MIRVGFFTENNPIAVKSVKATYWQDADTNSHDSQILELSTEESGSGFYFVLKTERWVFDSIQEFVNVLQDFQSRLSNDNIKREILKRVAEEGRGNDGHISISQLEEILNELK